MKLSQLLVAGTATAAAVDIQKPLGNFGSVLEHAGVDLNSIAETISVVPELIDTWKNLIEENSAEFLRHQVDLFNAKQFTPKNKVQDVFKDTSKFDILSKEEFPDYSLRTAKSNPASLGVDNVTQYSGYLDHLEDHFFYYFFESRNDPKTDPVILWLNGGPGCSSMTGLFFELGPSSIGPDIKPVYNPYSWNSNASVIFLEQPIGVGYSYGESEVSTSYAAARDVFIFLELFFQKYPQYLGLGFHIAGESYAGHYIPAIASEIINHADRSFELTSVMIGNGITDALIQDKYYQPMACGLGGHPAVLSDEECDTMDAKYPRCAALVKACYKSRNSFACVPANIYCASVTLGPYEKTGLNVYDIRGPCDGGEALCYKGLDYVEQYLNDPEVMATLGSDVEKYVGCDDDVFKRFALTGDESKPFQYFVSELLDKGYPVLIYAGDKDFICNWLGNHAWTDALEWILADSYRAENLKPWKNGKGEAGQVKSFGGLTFLRVYDAGHMVPYDQPENALDMVNTWISGNKTFGY
ncbi:CYFA0S01e16820g1_1 [Cyberlindnera fabianii]|uniref:Carboxypeptidase n=1 Tax=Cyberlindnera fabianii TaxID=36022 RepID=A0A061AKU9_CYBFA|nr:CYFA0S01e16820g1_1 [Cyberlindnera fabianii]